MGIPLSDKGNKRKNETKRETKMELDDMSLGQRSVYYSVQDAFNYFLWRERTQTQVVFPSLFSDPFHDIGPRILDEPWYSK